jgi:selenocysteine lyase/cysteine desulfurase
LGSSTTQLFRNLSYALEFPAGSELILSKIDHEANIASWVDLATRRNLIIKWWLPKTKENQKLEASDLKELLSDKTVLVTCTHASNILGTIHDIKAIAEAVHTVPGAFLCVDAVAYAPHRPIDVKDLGVDFYCFSWYKVRSSSLFICTF